MLDVFHLPTSQGDADIQIFTGPQTVTNLQWTTWIKPRGKSMLHILCIGGGGGGGGGFSGTGGSARGGGGGGGSAGITRVTIPLVLLPDILYIQAGAGGIGIGVGGTAGTGVLSWVGIYPHFENTNIIAVSGLAPATGGANGTSVAAGSLGTAGTVASITNMPLALLGQFNFSVGKDGTPGGGTASAGANINFFSPTTTFCTMGGTGGGGCTSGDFAGGAVNTLANSLLRSYASDQAPAGSNNGASGHVLWKPFFSFGGMGGGSSNAGQGGAGGDGGYGSGGGGGGAGNPGGKGGDGGPGIVMMMAW